MSIADTTDELRLAIATAAAKDENLFKTMGMLFVTVPKLTQAQSQ
jgi:hypothetical protein